MRVLFSPVWFPERLTWNSGDTELSFTVENQYNAIDLAECTLRVQQRVGGDWMTCFRDFEDIQVNCAPGARAEVRVPVQPHLLAEPGEIRRECSFDIGELLAEGALAGLEQFLGEGLLQDIAIHGMFLH